MIAKMSLVNSGERPSEGSSSNSRRGRAISARPIASHLLLAARKQAGLLALALAQAREPVVHLLDVARDFRVLPGEGAHAQVLRAW